MICDEIDYVPVFELAASILDILIDAPEDLHSPVIDPLVRAMENTRSTGRTRPLGTAVPHAAHRRQVHGSVLHVRSGGHAAESAGVP